MKRKILVPSSVGYWDAGGPRILLSSCLCGCASWNPCCVLHLSASFLWWIMNSTAFFFFISHDTFHAQLTSRQKAKPITSVPHRIPNFPEGDGLIICQSHFLVSLRWTSSERLHSEVDDKQTHTHTLTGTPFVSVFHEDFFSFLQKNASKRKNKVFDGRYISSSIWRHY